MAAWLGAIYWTTGTLDFILNTLIKQQVIERAVDTFHHKEAWYYYLTRLPLMFLPWTLLFFFLPWGRFLGKSMRASVAASRKPEAEGLGFLWSMVLSALVLLSLLSGKILVYFLPALPALVANAGTLAFYGLPLAIMEIWQYKSGDPLVALKAPRPVRALLYLALFYGIVIFGENHAQSFIYFQF